MLRKSFERVSAVSARVPGPTARGQQIKTQNAFDLEALQSPQVPQGAPKPEHPSKHDEPLSE